MNQRNVVLTRTVKYPAAWVFCYAPITAGTVAQVVPATNLPDYEAKGLVWVNTPELKDDAYGILLESGDYTETTRAIDALKG